MSDAISHNRQTVMDSMAALRGADMVTPEAQAHWVNGLSAVVADMRTAAGAGMISGTYLSFALERMKETADDLRDEHAKRSNS